MHKSFWMSRDAGCLADGEMGCDSSSRIEPKRGQWFMDTTGGGLENFSNKRQAIEVVNRPALGNSLMNVSPWHNNSGQFSDSVFGSETVRNINMVDRSFPSVVCGDMNAGGKDFDDQYCSNSSMGLSVSQGTQAPSGCLSVGGIRKVKVNQVRDSSRDFIHSYHTEDNAFSAGTNYSKNDNGTIYLHPTYGNEARNDMSISPTFSKADANFISMGHSFAKADTNFTSMAHNFNKEDHNVLSMGQPFEKAEGNFVTMTMYGKGDNNVISVTHYKGRENFISTGPSYDKGDGNFISMGPSYSKGEDNFISIGPTYDKVDSDITSVNSAQDKLSSSILSMGHNFNKVDVNTISFGGFHDEPETNPGCIISGYDVSLSNQGSAPDSEVQSQKGLVKSTADLDANRASKTNLKSDITPKNKEKTPKKVPPNNFPSNVKSLLSTGMLDGVPVKYVSWSREKSLKAKIKGTGYLCGCKECDSSKVLNAYEFERHANCKTKHPNNHIYFENGKTIYAVVQELKNTPQEMLFEAIQNVTGSQINQKNFRIWKASYQAATRELQRIYGKDEIVSPSLD